MVDKFLEKTLIRPNVFSVCTDGALSMMGCRKGFVSHVKKVNPSVQVIHCVLHRENLASRVLSSTLHDVMKNVIKIVNLLKLVFQIFACFKSCVHDVELRTNRYWFFRNLLSLQF